MIIVYQLRDGFRVVDAQHGQRVPEGAQCKEAQRVASYKSLDDALAGETRADIREALFRLDSERLTAYLKSPEKAALQAANAAEWAKKRRARLKRQGRGWCDDFVVSPKKQDRGES